MSTLADSPSPAESEASSKAASSSAQTAQPAQPAQPSQQTYRSIAVTPIAGSLGAEIAGVDLSQELPDEVIAEIRSAWLQHLVIFFRDQPITDAQFLALAHRFGEMGRYPMVPGIEGFPDIIAVLKEPHETHNFGGIWHSDTTYLEKPPSATMLLAREIPPQGGDTLFANQYAAYDALSDGLKEMLDGLRAINTSAKADVSKTREDRIGNGPVVDHESNHPVVRTHPETGRKALYVNIAHTARFEGWTEAESAPLLQFLHQHQVKPEFTCRFKWAVGSLAMWDNRCAQHNPINDYHGYRRRLHRITLQGDVPV